MPIHGRVAGGRYPSAGSVWYLVNTVRPKDADQGAVQTKIAWWRTWSSWCASMVDMAIVGLQLC